MIFDPPAALRQRISQITQRDARKEFRIWENTSQFMSIDAGDVLRLSGGDYLVMGHAREGRFGIDEQPKFWVKTAVDLATGEKKIIKLVFRETFESRIGATVYQCSRSPEKEGAILDHMAGHPNFMQGLSVRDAEGNLVRILDFIPGPSLYDYLRRLKMSHKEYYQEEFLKVMPMAIGCIEAIAQLHRQGLHHGDIRADHIIVNNQTGIGVWIDFDYQVDSLDYDLFCLGNVLLQVVGKGRHSVHDIQSRPELYPHGNTQLATEDMSLMFLHRVANLRKLFPYIPEELNQSLLRFSTRATQRYKDVDSLLTDLVLLFPRQQTKCSLLP